MGQQLSADTVDDSNFRFLSVAALLKKVHNGIGIQELYNEAERKFDILVEVMSSAEIDKTVIARFGYTMDELKEMSLFIFNRLISDTSANPYITLCVSESASMEEIKRRRNKLLYIFHPDRNPDELNNGNKTMKINEAYELIVNKYYKTDKQYKFVKTKIPRYNSYRDNKMFTLFIIFLIFFLFFLVIMKIINFY